jgi:hypothetical protein
LGIGYEWHVSINVGVEHDPDADITHVKRYPTKHRAHKGEMVRFVLVMLKRTTAPITSLYRDLRPLLGGKRHGVVAFELDPDVADRGHAATIIGRA